MKSIILKPHELQNIDRLACIVRPMKKQPKITMVYDCGLKERWYWKKRTWSFHEVDRGAWNPYAPICVGETAWVKETWAVNKVYDTRKNSYVNDMFTVWYEDGTHSERWSCNDCKGKWRTASSMPSWASRYTITFKSVEAKQLYDLRIPDTTFTLRSKWEKAYPKYHWISNPWLWLFGVEVGNVH